MDTSWLHLKCSNHKQGNTTPLIVTKHALGVAYSQVYGCSYWSNNAK
jgi:hypothetical protein